MKRRYFAQFSVEIEVDDKLFKSVLTDEWRKVMYPFHTREEVAGHLAYNLMRDVPLTSMDGFANQKPERARLIEIIPGDVEEQDE